MNSVGIENPLSILIDILYKKLRKENILNLSTLKEDSLKDLLVTAPEMMAAAFKESSLVQSLVDAGVLDTKCKRYLDVDEIINSFKIDWRIIHGGEN